MPSRLRPLAVSLGLIALTVVSTPSAPPAPASPSPTSAAARAPACASAEHRQFDFWLGDWDVRAPDGTRAGTNRVVSILDGCGVQENWRGARGTIGTSLNAWDAGHHVWRQTWIDSSGSVLLLEGTFRAGDMILSGETPQPGGTRVRERITWHPSPDGSVRQLWQQSNDDGRTWTTAFDGQYTRTVRGH